MAELPDALYNFPLAANHPCPRMINTKVPDIWNARSSVQLSNEWNSAKVRNIKLLVI
jgi:hypothetical protein